MRSSTHRGIVSRSFEYQNNKLFSLCDAFDLTKGTFLLFVASICVWLYAEAAEAQQKPDLTIPVTIWQDESAIAYQASKFSVGCNCDPLQAPVALKAASAAKTYKPAKRVKLNKLNHRQLSRSTVKFAEAEIVLSDQFSIEYISALPRAPGSDLEVLDNPERVRVQLPASQVQALADEGADITVLNNFLFIEGFAVEAGSPDDDMAILQSCTGPYEFSSNSTDVWIPDNTPGYVTVYSPISISGAPEGAVVTCIDVDWEAYHQWPANVVVALFDESGDSQYILWYQEYESPGYFGGTETGIDVFNGELVNQEWQLWAGEWYAGDIGCIDYWWIKVYYEETGVYCSASGGCEEYISRVQVGTIDNSSSCDGYYDYTAISTGMQIGTGYPITVTNGDPYVDEQDQCGIWVDWNQDMDFDDPGETIPVSGSPGLGPYYATITPVVDANLGDTRMRVRITWDEAPLPCGDADYGEVEDYTITVTGGATGEIHGSKFNDLDEDGDWDGGEPGIEGWEIYLDMNGNRQYDTGEPHAFTNSNGDYEFTGLAPGLYVVDEVHPAGWAQTYPGNEGRYTESIDADEIVTDRNFGNRQISGTFISIVAIEDTYANSGNPDTNYGSANGVVSGMDGGSVCRAFIKFDLSSIPAGQVVVGAKLRLENSFISIPAPELGVYYISDSWDESTLTWNNMPYSGELTPIDYGYISGEITVFDVTAHVDTQYVGDGIYSLQIRSLNESLDQSASFWSKDLGWPPIAPTLEVEYEPIFGGGSGEPNDPYQIWTGEQMNSIGLYPNRWSKSYKLMADISLADYTGSSYNIIGISPPHSGSRLPFRGIFDGNYHSISDFSYSSSNDSYVGLFGYVYYGTIKNLKVVSPNLTDPGHNDMKYVGAIAGCADCEDISGCSVVGGTVEGEAYVGGLVGLSKASFIADCSSSASVSGMSGVGGLVGEGSTFGGFLTITDCYSQGAVSGDDCVGGFMGDSSDVVIVNCYSTGLVSGDTNVGGFSGYNVNEMPIEDNVIGSFWDVVSSGESNSAAGTGLTTAEMQDANTFVDAGWDFVGEMGNGPSDDWAMPVGGGYPIMWYELPVAPNLPTFAGGSGTAGDPYLIGTEAELAGIGHNPRLMDKHFRLNSDLDMNGLKYYMIANRPYVFSGTFDGGGHTISNIVLEFSFNMSYCGFIGGLQGNEAFIQDLTLFEPNIVSTWGWGVGSLAGINENGTITNCHAVNAHVVGLFAVGGLVGANYSYGRISGCSATGNVSENTFMSLLLAPVGGLVGEHSFWAEIENSYAKCDVSGDDCVGGLVGTNVIYGILTNCYSQGTVTGTTELIGGLIGRNRGGTETNYCYSSCVVTGPGGTNGVGGFVGRMGTSGKEYYTACFWDSEVNPDVNGIGNIDDPNVIGESTANMQTESTFTDAGWDFVGEVINGPNDIWDICEGMNYPKLAWQFLLGDFVCPDGVDMVDYSLFAGHWMGGNCEPANDYCEGADLDGDGDVDFDDLKELAKNWLEGKI